MTAATAPPQRYPTLALEDLDPELQDLLSPPPFRYVQPKDEMHFSDDSTSDSDLVAALKQVEETTESIQVPSPPVIPSTTAPPSNVQNVKYAPKSVLQKVNQPQIVTNTQNLARNLQRNTSLQLANRDGIFHNCTIKELHLHIHK